MSHCFDKCIVFKAVYSETFCSHSVSCGIFTFSFNSEWFYFTFILPLSVFVTIIKYHVKLCAAQSKCLFSLMVCLAVVCVMKFELLTL